VARAPLRVSSGVTPNNGAQQCGNSAPLVFSERWGGLDNAVDVILKFRGCVVAALIGGGYWVASASGCAGNFCAQLFE
jgi:hypothetical protein